MKLLSNERLSKCTYDHVSRFLLVVGMKNSNGLFMDNSS